MPTLMADVRKSCNCSTQMHPGAGWGAGAEHKDLLDLGCFSVVSRCCLSPHCLFDMHNVQCGTGWGQGAEEKDLLDVGWFSVWVKLASLVVTAVLYIWTLVAPAVLSDRDFS